MNFTKYKNYKDSGLEWISEIPEDWNVRRVKDDVLSNYKSLSERTASDFEMLYIDISSVEIGGVINNSEQIFFKDAPSRARRVVRKNDVIISTVRTYLKAVAYFETASNNLICSTGFSVLSPRKTIYPTFLKYVILSESFIDKVISYSKGVSYPAINNSELIALPFIAPSKERQIAIAEYLDDKTTQIDKKIKLLQAKREKYQELRKTIINEAVTKGFDKNVELKDSGVEWLGKIPKHWEVIRSKNLFENVSIKNHPNEKLLSIYRDYGVIEKDSRDDNHNRASDDLSSYKFVKSGYLVINKMKAWQGSVGISNCDGIVSPAYITCKPIIEGHNFYFHYLLRCSACITEFQKFSYGVRPDQWDLRYSDFADFMLTVPPIEEQKQIAEYLDEKTAKIDQIILTIDKNIEALTEFRKTLINDAVTGKIKIVPAEKYAV